MKMTLASLIFLALPAYATPAVTVDLLDPVALDQLEHQGWSLGEMLGGKGAESRTSELYKGNALFRSFADQIGVQLAHDPKTDQLPATILPGAGDIPEMVRLIRGFEDKGKRSEMDKKGGYYIRHLSNNSQYPYSLEYDGDEPRHFDLRWLNSKFAFMKLVAVVNRMDRVDFDPNSCGEVRLVYRLSYQTAKSSSSLPFFLNLVRQYPKKENCKEFAAKWIGDPIQNGALKDLAFKQLEVGFQSLRFTSGYMQDFGGQAMYIQRIFRRQGDRLTPIPLENTPNVLEIEAHPELLKKFIAFLKSGDHLRKLDQGTLLIDFDPTFLTTESVSWSTLGRARTANKPYSRLLRDKTDLLAGLDLNGLQYIKSREALIERLDNLTCMGCHQSGGTAGFHMLGNASTEFSHGFNRQELPFSAFESTEVVRRTAYVNSLARGEGPNRFRPHSTFPEADWLGAGIPKFKELGLGQLCLSEGKHFAGSPSCAPIAGRETECVQTVASQDHQVLFGECALTKASFAGAVCWKGTIQENANLPGDRGPIPSFNLFAFQDKWKTSGGVGKAVPPYKCVLPQSGAPLGRSSRPCSVDEENFTNTKLNPVPPELCANQGGNGFDMCAATGDSGACLESRVVRSMLDTCYPGHFCREDYICQKFPEYQKIAAADYGKKKNGQPVNRSVPSKINGELIHDLHRAHIGFCVPTYFLFNMRLDGHPSPVTGLPPGEPHVDRSQPVRGYR
jgi:hypothetical protein